jgi:sirohydrochlorin cobaltochelatase
MRAVILIGHGSLRAGSGAAMIRLARRAQEAGVAPLVQAGFLNYSRPAFADTLTRCVAGGVTEVVVQPYFLVPGKFIREDIPRAVADARRRYPQLDIALAEPFGDHPALAELVVKRGTGNREQGTGNREQGTGRPGDRETGRNETGNGQQTTNQGLLLMAHGSPFPEANQSIYAVAKRAQIVGRYHRVAVSFLGLNAPNIPTAIADLVDQRCTRIAAVPYFLQLGGHVAEDLPAIIAAARVRHPHVDITLTDHLGYDPLLVNVIADRVAQRIRGRRSGIGARNLK